MGVQVRFAMYAPGETVARRACKAAYARLGQLDEIMSDYNPNSELMRLCAQAGGQPVRVSKELFFVLDRSLDMSRRSDGAFDVTVGPLVRLWREARKTKQFPSETDLARARELVGWQKVKLDTEHRTVQLLVPGMRLDLGGIGKGYAGDCALATLREYGITSALYEAGGDVVLGNSPPDGKGWLVQMTPPGMAKPAGTQPEFLHLANCAISTSGDTEQFVEFSGRRYSHIVDPHTGLGLTNRISVTIIAPDGCTAEGLSKVVSVLGEERGLAIVREFRDTRAFVRYAAKE